MGLLSKLFGKKSDRKNKNTPVEEERGKFMPAPETPTDDKFIMNFKENGGKFLYCTDQEDVRRTFDDVLKENRWDGGDVYCHEKGLQDFFQHHGLQFTTNLDAPFCVLTCEYLIGNTGAILLSSNQIGEKKLENLPYNFVIYAGTSQLTETLGEGLRGIKARDQALPTNITTIKTFSEKLEKEGHFMTYGSTTKNLYLLLLEDL